MLYDALIVIDWKCCGDGTKIDKKLSSFTNLPGSVVKDSSRRL